jgi:hypothetical protein
MLIFFYCRRFRLGSIRHSLNLFIIAQRYQAPSVEDFCMNYLLNRLPTSFAHLDSVEHYRQDFQLAPAVIWVCKLHDVIQPIPWALYMFNVQAILSKLEPNGPTQAMPYTRAVHDSHIPQLRALQGVTAAATAGWNIQVTAFYKSECSVDDWCGPNECCRRDGDGTLMGHVLIEAGVVDPLKRMSEILGACEREMMCAQCKQDLRRELEEAMESVYANVCSAVSVLEGKQF